MITTKIRWKDFVPSIIYGSAIITQIILVFFYYNFYNLRILHWLGWGIMALFFVIGGLPKDAFKKYGETEKGKSYLYTTKLVDKGIFAIIRHPYWLCWIILSISLTLISQHIIMIILTMIAIPIIYLETFSLDKGLIDKFGNNYKQYKKNVPRMNLILGLIIYSIRKKKNTQ
ncbi:MAG: methyltransferase family protein [Promethearchaeota archaeon]